MTATNYDVIVVGLGAVGSAALYALAKQGARVLGIDRYAPPHTHGSSHGESRITRQAIGEGESYVPLVLRSNEMWEELEAATGMQLLVRCGFLFITRDDQGTSHHGKSAFLESTRRAADRFGIFHEMLDSGSLARRFPQFLGLHGDEKAYFEPGGGFVRPEACITACLSEARRLGAAVRLNARVEQLERSASGCVALLESERVAASHVILATGAWIAELAEESLGRLVSVHRQLLHWFPVVDAGAYPEPSPTFIWTHGLTTREQFYGFPPIDGLVKVAREDYSGRFDPEQDNKEVEPGEGVEMARQHVNGRLAGLGPLPVRSASCHYAVTPDSNFLIDTQGCLTAISACSGHGFKHAAAVGEAAAQAALSLDSPIDLSMFRADRLNI